MTDERTIWDYWAPRYERLLVQRFSLGPSRRLVHERLDAMSPPPRRILDLGCGIGQLAREIAERRPDVEVVGLDTSAGMIGRARIDYAAPNLTFLCGPLESLPVDEPFCAIVSTHAFPYVPDKPAALRRIREVLVPDGRLLLIQANDEGWYDRAWLFFVKRTTTAAVYHPAATLQAMMVEAGLRPDLVRSIDKAFFVPSIQLVEAVR